MVCTAPRLSRIATSAEHTTPLLLADSQQIRWSLREKREQAPSGVISKGSRVRVGVSLKITLQCGEVTTGRRRHDAVRLDLRQVIDKNLVVARLVVEELADWHADNLRPVLQRRGLRIHPALALRFHPLAKGPASP